MKRLNKLPIYWGIIHGCNDFASGFMLSFLMIHQSNSSLIFILLYSILAFGGQLPLGLWLDKTQQLKDLSLFSLALLLFSLIIFLLHPLSGIILIGIASAGIHVAGGTVCLILHENKSGPLGLFTSPGVLGLTIGIFCGNSSSLILLFPFLIAAIFTWLVFKKVFPVYLKQNNNQQKLLDHHDYLMLGILLFMTFRSFIFDVVNYLSQQSENGLLIIGVAAFIGKMGGGFAADKVGWKTWIYITLPLSFILFQFGKENIYMIAFGIACLQSSVPLTIMLMHKSIPSMPGSATALSLGTCILIAGIPLYAMKSNSILTIAFNNNLFLTILIILAISICICIYFLYKKKFRTAV